MKSVERGRLGEDRAVSFLEAKGFKVIARNYRRRIGEIDIIACGEGVVIFCEVKNWQVFDESSMEYAINERKKRKILNVAKAFLSDHRELDGLQVRFDVLFIGAKAAAPKHIVAAFGEG